MPSDFAPTARKIKNTQNRGRKSRCMCIRISLHHLTSVEYNAILSLEKLYKCKITLLSDKNLSINQLQIRKIIVCQKTPSVLDHYPDYELTIGIEVHVQLNTNSKIFCSCANQTGQEPNTNICNICTAQPGSLPALNKKVIEYAIKAGLATHSTIAAGMHLCTQTLFLSRSAQKLSD